jgi:hypothetical protein
VDKFFKLWAAEPAVIIGVVRAVLVAAVGFGLNLSTEQITSLVLAVEAIGALVTRQSVFAPATVQRLVDETTSTMGDTVTDLTGKHRRPEEAVELPELQGGPDGEVPPLPKSAYPPSAVELLNDDDPK